MDKKIINYILNQLTQEIRNNGGMLCDEYGCENTYQNAINTIKEIYGLEN